MAYWYLDSAATGTNDGTSWTNAWHWFDHIVWGAGGVVAGDTLYISGGAVSKTYTAIADGMLTVGASGAAGNRITIATGAKSPSPSGHDGTVIFDGDALYWGLVYTTNRNYITIDGEKSGARNWTCRNSLTSNSMAALIHADWGTGIKITYMTLLTCAEGIYATAGNALEVSYCSITDIQHECGIKNIISNAGVTAYGTSKIHHNTFQCNYNVVNGTGPDGIQSSTSTDIYDNVFTSAGGTQVGAQHPDYIQTAGPYLRIYNNEFRNPVDSAIDIDQTNNWGETVHHIKIYNNVFCADSTSTAPAPNWPAGIRFYFPVALGAIDDFIIANNSFIDMSGDGVSGGTIISGDCTSETVANSLIKNNLFYNASRTNYRLITIDDSSNAVAADWNVDYNLRHAGAHGLILLAVDGDAGFVQTHDRLGEPTFVSYAHTNPANDFHLAAGDTAARGQGVDLSAYFTTDKDGKTRGAWDIGAYEYADAGNPWVMVYG